MTSPTTDASLERLRYPVGRLQSRTGLGSADRARMIDTIAAFPAQFRAAAAALGDAGLDTPYRPGGWTKRQVVHHVVDSHLNAFIRFQFALAQDEPTIAAYDEAAWSELPYARTAPVDDSLRILEALHARWAATLRLVEDAQWSRAIIHLDNGRMTMDDLLQMYEWHCRHHLAHLKS
jgi:hypothetical protein